MQALTLTSTYICAGKSAILQAMQFCLGVTARNTGRATSAKQFILTGASHAKASITLWNTGDDAYMPAEYGPTITIEREVRASTGACTFTIKKHDGSKVRRPGVVVVLTA